MDTTVAQVTTNALRLVGQMQHPGRNPSPEQLDEVTFFLNQMLSGWNIMRNSLFTIARQIFTLTPNEFIYTIGPNATGATGLVAPRPNKIVRANCIYQTTPQLLRLPIELIDVDQWAAIQVPQLFAIPLKLYYNAQYTSSMPTGLGQILLWPGPQSAYDLELFAWQALQEALGSGDPIYLPDGYARALSYNLAAEIIPLYQAFMTEMRAEAIVKIASESRDAISSLNAPSPVTAIDPALTSTRKKGFNWLVSVS